MKINLFAFDVDGTLLNSERKIPESTLKSLKKLKELGYKIVIASGRNPILVKPDELDNNLIDYYICNNGAYIMDNNGNKIFKDEIMDETLEKLTGLCVKYDNPMQVCFDDSTHVYHNFEAIEQMIMNWVGKKGIVVDSSKTRDRHLINKPFAGVIDRVENIEVFRNALPELGFDLIREKKYDFFNDGISKASGIARVCEYLDLKLDNVMAFGDNYNDLEMLSRCGIGVAMGNAIDEVKLSANYVTTSSDDKGIYNALKYYNIF